MFWKNTPLRYGMISQFIHWISVFLVGLAWVLGLLGDELPKGAARELGETIHISAGEIIGGLLVIRLVWLMISRPPQNISFPFIQFSGFFARFAHITLYALLFGVIYTGIMLLFAKGQALPFFGIYEISSPWIMDRALAHSIKEIHEFIAHSLIILATLHAGAALVHHSVLKDETLKRMLP